MVEQIVDGQEAAPAGTPTACRIDTGVSSPEQESHYQRLVDAVRSTVLEVRELPDGYALRYPSDATSIMTVAEWITMEQRCCSFVDFELHVEPEGRAVWLNLSGGPGVKEFLQAEIEGLSVDPSRNARQ